MIDWKKVQSHEKDLHLYYGIIHLVRTQNFPKNKHFLPLIRTLTRAYQGVRNVSFSTNPACVLNE